MGRKKAIDTQTEPPPEVMTNGPQEAEPTSEPPDTVQPGVKKIDAVRAALAEGIEKPDEAVAWIKEKFGIDLPKPQWSSYRSQIKSKEAGKTATPRQPSQLPPTPAKQGDVVDALETIKGLVQQLGADRVKRIVSLFE